MPPSRHSSSSNLVEKATTKAAEYEILASDLYNSNKTALEKSNWDFLAQRPLVRHQSNNACVTISRTTLITTMCITNVRKVFTDVAGFPAGYGSYSGQWYLTWPIGQEATVKFAPHDSHSAATDVYPPSFVQRVDRCVEMLAGIVAARGGATGFQVAFCGRKTAGR